MRTRKNLSQHNNGRDMMDTANEMENNYYRVLCEAGLQNLHLSCRLSQTRKQVQQRQTNKNTSEYWRRSTAVDDMVARKC